MERGRGPGQLLDGALADVAFAWGRAHGGTPGMVRPAVGATGGDLPREGEPMP
jgi:hypothetical protein